MGNGILPASWAAPLQGVLRIVTGFLFLQHGTAKFFMIPAVDMFKDGVPLFSLFGAAGVLEVVGGLLFLIGLFTRYVAFVLSGMMAVAYFMVHAPQNFSPIVNGGELAVMYCFVYLFYAAAGPGSFSLDRVRGK